MPRVYYTEVTERLGAAGNSAGRAYAFVARQPSWFQRFLVGLVLVTLFGIGLLIIIPLLALGAVVVFVLFVVAWIQSLFAGAKRPGGMMDKRENVRVRDHSDT